MLATFRFLLLLFAAAGARASQSPLLSSANNDREVQTPYYEFSHQIKRVAVIGAGPSGLLHTAALLEHGFEVKLFERAPKPGGVWFYSDKTRVPASLPGTPTRLLAYTPDVPHKLPLTRVFRDGDNGLSNDWRIREQWSPSPAWRNMTTTGPKQILVLPNVGYPPELPWKLGVRDVQRHVRQYATSIGINSNDEEHEHVISYFTRVERMQKIDQHWVLTLRKFTPRHDGSLQVDWFTEEFDAVVVTAAAKTQGDAAHLPPIPGIVPCLSAFPKQIFHSAHYREPNQFVNKNVLVVGGYISAIGISKELIAVDASVTVSVRPSKSPMDNVLRAMFPPGATFVNGIESFGKASSDTASDFQDVPMLLKNGSTIRGFDYVIFATGYRVSLPFLVDLHNETIRGYDEPETEVAPIVTDGTHLRSLHWTGHYINDPTLSFASGGAWLEGKYQAQAVAKVWAGKARLPSVRRMWAMYPGAGYAYHSFPGVGIRFVRLFIAWLNDACLEFGGRFVSPLDIETFQAYSYSTHYDVPALPFWLEDLVKQEEATPRSEWEAYNGTYARHEVPRRESPSDEVHDVWDQLAAESRRVLTRGEEKHWADLAWDW